MKGGIDGASTGKVDLERGLQSQRDALMLGELASVEIQASQRYLKFSHHLINALLSNKFGHSER